jgi:ATP-dependent DNA helicase DinG
VLALKQGVGRLIRDFDDFGVIVLGDPRIKTKPYGRVFMQALPQSPVITDGAVGAQFLTERLRRLNAAPAASRLPRHTLAGP